MNKVINMNFITDLLEGLGLTSLMGAIFLKMSSWLLDITWDSTLTILISIFGLLYIMIKCYDGYLGIVKKRRDLK